MSIKNNQLKLYKWVAFSYTNNVKQPLSQLAFV